MRLKMCWQTEHGRLLCRWVESVVTEAYRPAWIDGRSTYYGGKPTRIWQAALVILFGVPGYLCRLISVSGRSAGALRPASSNSKVGFSQE
jgi:hypothetical protein